MLERKTVKLSELWKSTKGLQESKESKEYLFKKSNWILKRILCCVLICPVPITLSLLWTSIETNRYAIKVHRQRNNLVGNGRAEQVGSSTKPIPEHCHYMTCLAATWKAHSNYLFLFGQTESSLCGNSPIKLECLIKTVSNCVYWSCLM